MARSVCFLDLEVILDIHLPIVCVARACGVYKVHGFYHVLPREAVAANRIPWVNPGDNLQRIFSLLNDQIQFRHRLYHEATRHKKVPASTSEQSLS